MFSILGHETAIAALQRALTSERPAHAWLFSGPEGVGKMAAALEFAAALNCTSDGDKPCRECRPCSDTLAAKHPDVEVVAPGGMCDEPDHRDHPDSRDLRICQIRRLERILSLSSYVGGRRIAIVDAADTMRAESANAFLKTLEEPPAGSVIILLVEREERLPDTVMSRCQRVSFRPVDRDIVAQALVERGAEPRVAEAIAGAAGGRIGWALRAMADESMLGERSQALDQAVRMAHASRFERFAWARQAELRGDSRDRYQRELAVWENWWRDVLMTGAGGEKGAVNSDRAAVLAEEGTLYATADVVKFLRVLMQTREHLLANVDPQLLLENLTLDLPSPVRSRGR